MYHVNIGIGTVTYFLCLLEDNDLKDTICIQTWPSQHEGLLGTTRTMSLIGEKKSETSESHDNSEPSV